MCCSKNASLKLSSSNVHSAVKASARVKKDMIVLCLVAKRSHPFFHRLEHLAHAMLRDPGKKRAVACHLHHGVQIAFRFVETDRDQRLKEMVAFSLVGLTECVIAEEELLRRGVALRHGEVVIDGEGQTQRDHRRAVLYDHLQHALCQLPDLRVNRAAVGNGAVGGCGVANDGLDPVHAVDQTLLDGEEEEGERVGENLRVGAVAERFDGGTQRADDAGQPVVHFAWLLLLLDLVVIRASRRYSHRRGGLWEAAGGRLQHRRHSLDELENAPDGDDGSFRVVGLHHVQDLKQLRSVDGAWVVQHALEKGSQCVVLNGEGGVCVGKQRNTKTRGGLELGPARAVAVRMEELHVQGSVHPFIDAPHDCNASQLLLLLPLLLQRVKAFIKDVGNRPDFVHPFRHQAEALDAGFDTLHAVRFFQSPRHSFLVGLQLIC